MKRVIVLIIVLVSIDNTLAADYKCDTTSSCGCSSSTTTTVLSKIVGGETAPNNAWRWMVSLQRSTGHMCGASLVSATHAVTAAHCIADYITKPSALKIVVGINNLNDQTSTRQLRPVSKIIKHPNYQNGSELNDIAIIQFSSLDVTSNSKLAFICLPSAGKDPFKTNTNLVAIGWGVLYEASSYSSNSLQQVTVKAYPDSSTECIHAEKTNSTTQFCAGVSGGGKDTCQGDSGGPLMAFQNNVWVLAGITSKGRGCARVGLPGVYTRVSAFSSFLTTYINQNTTSTQTQNTGQAFAYSLFGITFWSFTLIYLSFSA